MRAGDLTTPALVVDAGTVAGNIAAMAAALPGPRLRPHVKAHKSTALAGRQAAAGHPGFTCATVREVEGMAAAGLGHDLLLANEVLDARRLGTVAAGGARVTVAVDSPATVEAALAGGVREVVVDVNIGLPRCGCRPEDAGRLADLARRAGLTVRGVMGYEGHLMGLASAEERAAGLTEASRLLLAAAADVGGEMVSAGGTGTYALNTGATEIQAGSYVLMDSAYGAMDDLPFGQALFVLATVLSTSAKWAVADAGLKALSVDHGKPTIEDRTVWFCSDEHTTFSPPDRLAPGDRLLLTPSHVDPTVALHGTMWVVDDVAAGGDAEVVDRWAVDLRGW